MGAGSKHYGLRLKGKQTGKLIPAICLLYITVYIVPLNVRPAVVPDETRYAEIPREMLCTGDWTVPRLDGVRYFEKPVLGYWANALSIRLFGENSFALRLPSALAVGLSALLLFFLIRRFTGDTPTGLLASGVFLTCAEVFAVGVFSVLDSLFSFFVTATIICFYFAYTAQTSRKKTIYWTLCGAGCGLAFLTKGFLAFAVPVSVVAPFLLWDRKGKGSGNRIWLAIVTAALVCLPWSIMIYLRENDFWRYFFWEEHVKRALAEQAQHEEPFWFYIPVLLGGALPWTLVLPLVVTGLRKIRITDTSLRLALCWLIFPFLLFSLCRGKLGTYILPCFPAAAALITLGLTKYFATGNHKAFDFILRSSALAILIGAGVFVVFNVAPSSLRIYEPQESWKWILLTAGLLFYGVFLLLGSVNTHYMKKLGLCCIGPTLLLFSAHFGTPDRLQAERMPGDFLRTHSARIRPDTILVSDNYLTPAVCWFYQRDNVYVLGRPGELAYGLQYADAAPRLLTMDAFSDLVAKHTSEGPVVLITREKRYEDYRKNLPNADREIREDGFVMAEFSFPYGLENASGRDELDVTEMTSDRSASWAQ